MGDTRRPHVQTLQTCLGLGFGPLGVRNRVPHTLLSGAQAEWGKGALQGRFLSARLPSLTKLSCEPRDAFLPSCADAGGEAIRFSVTQSGSPRRPGGGRPQARVLPSPPLSFLPQTRSVPRAQGRQPLDRATSGGRRVPCNTTSLSKAAMGQTA